jgi:putative colanic acid biosynthesis UDP-glucose lipid carrier transferase
MNNIFTSDPGLVVVNYGENVFPRQSSHWSDPSQTLLKRGLDVFLSVLVVVFILSWVFPLIAILIKSSSKGPLLFKQLRHGRDNVPFYCYKFRTMRVNDAADTQQATEDDPRVTKIGAFLRRSSLDELPQFLNVLKGEMSIVGPRPHAVRMNERFSEEVENFMFRHAVKPGITGLAQSKGYRGETKDFYDIYSRCKLDLFYIKNWSVILDLRIIIWTSVALLMKNHRVY